MDKVTRNEADFSELFEFAEKKFGMDWNTCCELFHDSERLKYEGYTDICKKYLEVNEKADEVIFAYMTEHGVEECRIYS